MRIDGSKLNPFWAQELQKKQQDHTAVPGMPTSSQGESSSGFNLKVDSYTPAPPPGLEGVYDELDPSTLSQLAPLSITAFAPSMGTMGTPKNTSEAFALEIARRIGPMTDEEGNEKSPQDLAQALADAMDFIKNKHGEQAATTAMAKVLSSTGRGTSEETLSKGLVKVLEFVDKNFGIAAGDEAMAHFNGALNRSMNEYFENGLTEKFMVASDGMGSISVAMSDMKSRFARQAAAGTTPEVDQQSQNEKLLEELTETLEEETSLEEMANTQVRKAMEAYGMIATPEPEFLNTTA